MGLGDSFSSLLAVVVIGPWTTMCEEAAGVMKPLTIQQATWQHRREACLDRIEAAWAARAGLVKRGVDTEEAVKEVEVPPKKRGRIRREAWPEWPRRGARSETKSYAPLAKEDVACTSVYRPGKTWPLSKVEEADQVYTNKNLKKNEDNEGGDEEKKSLTMVVERIENGRVGGVAKYCAGKIWGQSPEKLEKNQEGFYVVDLGAVERLYKGMTEATPRIRPHYAVKCFPNQAVLRVLAELGCGFDCASAREVRLALQNGAKPEDIVFANPCKGAADLQCIKELNIPFTTVDRPDEIDKIADAQCDAVGVVLRIRCDDPTSRLPFGVKYGCLADELPVLRETARKRRVPIVGISFHVGSGARSADAYRVAVADARAAAEYVDEMRVLDVGGGFCGDFDDSGHARVSAAGDLTLSCVLSQALDHYFPRTDFPSLQIVSEPGRYFAEAAASLCLKVIGTRTRTGKRDAWIADGCYGAFNALIYDAWAPSAAVLRPPSRLLLPGGGAIKKNTTPSSSSNDDDDENRRGASSDAEAASTNGVLTTVFGPTCDSMDCVFANVPNAPCLHTGDWLLFPNCGAYTLAGATDFNGIPATALPVFYVHSNSMARNCPDDDLRLPVLYSPELPFDVERHF